MTYTKQELHEMIARMRSVSDTYYFGAVRTGCHPFIEMCGLMNQYIAICAQANNAGIDFTETTKHAGGVLPMEEHDVVYLGEKFACIFGNAFADKPELWALFESAVMSKARKI